MATNASFGSGHSRKLPASYQIPDLFFFLLTQTTEAFFI